MIRREVKRIQSKVSKLLDPLGLFILISLFVLPALAVVNLSPRGGLKTQVLGTESKPGIGVVLVGGVHDFINDERIDFPNEGHYIYKSLIIKHNKGEYSKPIIQISNFSDKEEKIKVWGGVQNPTGSAIALVVNSKTYVLQNPQGNILTREIPIPGNAKSTMYLVFNADTNIAYNEEINIDIVKE